MSLIQIMPSQLKDTFTCESCWIHFESYELLSNHVLKEHCEKI